MTDHNTDTHTTWTTNEGAREACVYFYAAISLMLAGKFCESEDLDLFFWFGAGLFLLPFLFVIIVCAYKLPVLGAIMAFAGVNITMIAMHCPFSLIFLPFSCAWVFLILRLLFIIGQLCQTSYYQRKAVVQEAVVVHRFTTEENNNNNNSASSLVNYYWVGEYEAPSSPRYVTPNNGDEKRTTSIQLFHNNGNQQQGAVEKNGLEECSCTEEEEEEVCYKIQQQRFHKKFLVTGDLYDAASLEVSVLPGRPKSAMLTKQTPDYFFDDSLEALFLHLCFAFVFCIPIWILGVKAPLLRFSEQEDVCRGCIKCTAGWQAFLPYIASVVMAILAVSNLMWKEYQKREFAAVTVDNPAGGEQELVTVVGPQNKKEEDEYHHHINDDGDDKTETETACTSRELDNDDETACTRELDNDDDTTYI